MIPDETLIKEISWPKFTGARILKVCRASDPELKTVGDLRSLSDAELLRYGNLGQKALKTIREIVGSRDELITDEMVEKALEAARGAYSKRKGMRNALETVAAAILRRAQELDPK